MTRRNGGLHLKGMANPASHFWKIAKMVFFNPWMKWLFKNFIHKVPLTLSKWINGIVSIPSKRIFFFSLLILIYFFNYETIVIKSAKSFALSDPNLSSVQWFLLVALYSNLNPVAVQTLSEWKWRKSWLLEEIRLGGRESPQYGFPNMGDVFEPPS